MLTLDPAGKVCLRATTAFRYRVHSSFVRWAAFILMRIVDSYSSTAVWSMIASATFRTESNVR